MTTPWYFEILTETDLRYWRLEWCKCEDGSAYELAVGPFLFEFGFGGQYEELDTATFATRDAILAIRDWALDVAEQVYEERLLPALGRVRKLFARRTVRAGEVLRGRAF